MLRQPESLGPSGRLLRATGWMGVALSSFALLAVSARELLDTLEPVQFLFARTALEVEEVNILRGIATQLIEKRKRRDRSS